MIQTKSGLPAMRALDATELGQVSGGSLLSLLSLLCGGTSSCTPSPCGGTSHHRSCGDRSSSSGCTPPPPVPAPVP